MIKYMLFIFNCSYLCNFYKKIYKNIIIIDYILIEAYIQKKNSNNNNNII